MKKVIIIGAGPAGVTAGYELVKQCPDYEVVILEETNEIGGISRTVRYHGNRMDIGGHRFFSKEKDVVKWWEEIMPQQGKGAFDDKVLGRKVPLHRGGPDPDKEDKVMLTRHRVSRIYYKKKFFDYPIRISASTIKNMGVVTTLQAGISYLHAAVHKQKEKSLEDFYINRFGRKLYSMFFEGYTEKLWGRHPRDISPDWGAQRVKGLSILAILKDILDKTLKCGKKDRQVETSLIEQFSYPKYGPGQLWETAAEKFEKMGGTIKKNCKVTKLTQQDGNIVSVTYEKDGQEVTEEADIFISSMPIKDLVAGLNGVPKEMGQIAAGLPYRDFVTVGLLVRKLNLKNETKLRTLANIVPDCWIYVQDQGVKLGRIQIFNNWSPYLVKNPEETVWIGLEYFCSEGDDYWNKSEKDWVRFGVKELLKMGVISKKEDVLDAHREKVKKAYPAYFDTYAQMDELIAYLNTITNLYCVGRNGQHRYNNMDHSMATSFEAVRAIKAGSTDKENLWKVNTDQQYHETKEDKKDA